MAGSSLVSFLVRRSWRTHRLRTALAVLGIALGVGVVLAIHITDHNTIQTRLRAAGGGVADFEVLPRDRSVDPEAAREGLLARPDVAGIALLRRGEIEVSGPAGEPVRGMLVGLGPFPADGFGFWSLVEGMAPVGLEQVVLGAEWAASAGIAVGDRVELTVPTSPLRARCVDGKRVAADAGDARPGPIPVTVVGLAGNEGLGEQAAGQVVFAAHDVARALLPRDLTLLQLKRQPGADLDRLRQALLSEFVVRDERSALLGESADERAFRNGVKLVGGLALMLGMFVVFQTLSQALVERLRQIGILRCLGVTPGGVARIFLVDALLLSIAGVVAGLGVGLLIAAVLQRAQISTLGMFKAWELVEFPWRPAIYTGVLGVGFTMAGAVFPLWRARKIAPLRVLHARGLDAGADVLRGVNVFLFLLLVVVLPVGYLGMTTLLAESERETREVLLQLAGLLLGFGVVLLVVPGVIRTAGHAVLWPLRGVAPLAVHLVGKSLQRHSGRFAASVCGLSLCLTAWIALESLTTSLHGEARAFAGRALENRLFIRVPPTDVRGLERFRSIPGVESVETTIGPVFAPVQVSAVDPAWLSGPDGAFAGRPELARRFGEVRSLVVSPRLARISDLDAGSALTLMTDGGPVAYTVLAVSDRVGFFPDDPAFALAHPRFVEQDFCVAADRFERLTLHLVPGTRPADVLGAVRRAEPGLRFAKSGAGILDYLLRDVTRDFRLFQILLGLVLLLGGVGVLNAMTIAALGRAREIGVLRALGASRRQLRGMFVVEGAVVGTLASATAWLLGIPLGQIVVRGMNRVAGLDAPFLVPWHAVALIPVMGLGIGLGAALVPGIRAARVEAAEAVRFE
ncbi:MAG: FtsX-like permease family protein [Planctomycetota bacterium]|nr:FtsX-like permease family protein [Planctomycetota bacterium]